MEQNNEHGIIATLCKKAKEAINEAYRTIEFDCEDYENGEEIIITHQTPCGVIELYCEVNEDWQVCIDNTTAHALPRLHEEILKALPSYTFDFEAARQSCYDIWCSDEDAWYSTRLIG